MLPRSLFANQPFRYGTPRGSSLDLKERYAFAVKARDELALWKSKLSETLHVDMMDLECKHPPHVLQLQYVLESHQVTRLY